MREFRKNIYRTSQTIEVVIPPTCYEYGVSISGASGTVDYYDCTGVLQTHFETDPGGNGTSISHICARSIVEGSITGASTQVYRTGEIC